MNPVRSIIANNASAMTLDGTRTYIVGERRVAVIDPGPLQEEHLRAVADAIGSGASVSVLVTHSHSDHADGAAHLAEMLHTDVRDVRDNDVIETDAGQLHAIATPGHTPDHMSFHLAREAAVFCGDLMMGGLDTALVAVPEGNLRDYLHSLDKLRALRPRIIYPAHGDPFHDPDDAIARYVHHRDERVRQVADALSAGARSNDELIDRIYGKEIDPRLRSYAGSAIEAYVDYLHESKMN